MLSLTENAILQNKKSISGCVLQSFSYQIRRDGTTVLRLSDIQEISENGIVFGVLIDVTGDKC